MNKRRLVTLVVLGISLIVAIVTTFSYAYWTKSVNQTGENEITALGCFEIEYTDTEEINIDKAYPISDEKGKAQEVKYTFTITNTCDVLMQTQINIESLDVSGKALPNNYVKAYLTSNNKDIILTKLDNSIKVENLEEDVRETYKLKTEWLRPHDTKTYELRIWVASDVEYTDDSYNATFKGKIHIAPSIYDGDLAVLDSTSYSDSRFFRSSTYKTKIKTLTFEKGINIPENSTEVWDIGVSSAPELIKAYIVPVSEGSSYYDLHIQSDSPMFANEDMSYWFTQLTNLDSIEGLEYVDFSGTINMEALFGSYFYYPYLAPGYNSSVFTLDVSSVDTSNVINMSYMFYCSGYNNPNFTLDVSNLNTSNVENMSGMFSTSASSDKYPKSTIYSLNLSNFDTSKVTNMSYMFYSTGYSNPNFTLDVSNFDTSKVTGMSYMFYNTGYSSNVFILDLGDKFDTSKVTDMDYMFYSTGYNSKVFTLNLGDKFDTSNVTNMGAMFDGTGYKNPNFTLDLGDKFDTSQVTNMSSMFSETGYNSKVFTLNLGDKFDTSQVTSMAYMFYGTGYNNPNFTLDVSNFDTSNVTNMRYMFYSTGYKSETFTLDLGDKFDTSKVTDMAFMFDELGYNNPNFTLDVSNFDTSNVTNMGGMFYGTGYKNPNFTLDVSGFDTSQVTSMAYMFYGTGYHSEIVNINLSGWDTSNVTDMHSMFYSTGCYSREFTLDLSHFNTSKVIDMRGMFSETGRYNPNFELNINNWDTSNVTDMSYMFSYAGYRNLNLILNISDFDTSRVKNMSKMFANHIYLKVIFGNELGTSNVDDMRGMFSNVSTLEIENYKGFDTSNVKKYSEASYGAGMFEECKNVNMEIDILTPSTNINSSSNYYHMFYNAATEEGSDIKVNYTAENQSLVEAMVAKKYPSDNNNVHIGDLLTEHTITINDSNVTSNLTSAMKTKKIKLSSIIWNKIITSFKMNGELINGNTFIMPNENVEITDITYETVNYTIIESEHYPYPTNMNNEVYYEHVFDGATSLTIKLTYQTYGTYLSWIYLYDEEESTTPYGGTDNKYGGSNKTTDTITIDGNYIKITFNNNYDLSYSNYYGFKAVITPNYD